MVAYIYHLFFASMGQRLAGEEGATAVEYGVMLALIVAVIVVIVAGLGQELIPGFETANDAL